MNHSSDVHRITRLAILVAIILVMSFTPLGYLKGYLCPLPSWRSR